MDRQSQPILTIKSENRGDGKDDLREGNKAEENPPVKLENKLAHLEKLQTCRGGKLDNQNKDLFSNIHTRTKSADTLSKCRNYKKRERERSRRHLSIGRSG